MDVTALTQIKSNPASGKESISVDKGAFTGELEKLTNTTSKKDTLDSAEDLSQSLDESEVEEKSEDEDTVDFTLIYPFLRLNSDIESLSKGEQLKTLHIEDLPIDKQVISELVKSMPDNEMTDLLGNSQEQTSEGKEIIRNQPEHNAAKLTEAVTDDVIVTETLTKDTLLTETKPTSEISEILESFTSELAGTEKLSEDKTPIDQKSEHVLKSKILSTDTQSLEEESQLKTDEAPKVEVTGKEMRAKNGAAIPVETSVKSETVLTETNLPFSELGTDLLDELNDSKQTSKAVSSELNTNAVLPNRSQNSVAVQPAETPQAPVTKEQSVEIIQDMMMTVVTDESGKEIFKSTLTLTPETLGEVKIELTYNEEGLSGKLVFESDETRKWMESQWHQLKQPLETKGLTLNQFDFSVTEPSPMTQTDGQSFSQEFEQADQQASKESQTSPANKLTVNSDEETTQAENKSSITRLNIYA